MPFFSICIAAYNADRYIDECLRSLGAQTFHDYEVIVVDDGSSEPLSVDSAVIALLSSCRVIRIENSGPYAARQKAFDVAQGDVILCVDADDKLIDPNALAKMKSAFEDDVDVVIFNASKSEVCPSRLFDFSVFGNSGPVSSNVVWELYTTSWSLNSLCCKAFKRSLYSTSAKKKRPRLLMAEDRLQSLEIMAGAHSFALVNEPLYYYRPNSASTTNAGYDPSYFRQQCYVEAEVLDFMKKQNMPTERWASYFLRHTSNVLLGIRYNSSLARPDRIAVYESIFDEPVVREAFAYFEQINLSSVAGARLNLLRAKRFALLDASMCPWKVGSVVKRLLK